MLNEKNQKCMCNLSITGNALMCTYVCVTLMALKHMRTHPWNYYYRRNASMMMLISIFEWPTQRFYLILQIFLLLQKLFRTQIL